MRPDRLLPRPATPGARHRPGAGPEGRPGWAAAALRLVVASAVLPAAVARGQTEGDGPEDPLAVRVPVRLTAGGANQFMGRLSPDGDALYFVSDEAGTTELFVQSPVDGGAPERLFDESGDVAWPEVGPDGNRLAYVSYVRDATGDACVRRVRGGNGGGVGGARGERCLTRGGRGAELQVVWLGPDVLGVLSREDLHAGFSLRRFSLADGASQPLDLGDDAVGVAVSPAGGFLAYVPLEPRRQDVGVTFVNRTGSALRFVRLRGNGEADSGSRRDYAPPLPGVTGYPAFGPAGRHLYFSQYLNDTNRDGRIDGNDNSVVFRVPFDPEAPAGTSPVDPAATPTQLTSARWNCHYPAPAAGRLLMTCSHGGSLDIYSLPLDGAVPTEMSLERLRGERAAARDLWTKLLLSGRMLALEPDPAARLGILEEMTLLHLGLREYESASHYADRLAASARDATEAARVGRLLGVLAAHRRDDRDLARGEPSRAYLAAARARLAQAEAVGREASTDAGALARLVQSEIESDMGDKGASLAHYSAIDLGALRDPGVLNLAAIRAATLFGRLGLPDALRETLARLAQHPAYDAEGRLRQGRALVEELRRGQGTRGFRRALEAWRPRAASGSELAVLLEVELALTGLTEATENYVREAVFQRYRETDDPALRRAISLSAIQAASRQGNEFVQTQFATTWASGIPPDDPERKYAVSLFETLTLERAYGELSDGEIADAAAFFFRAGRNAGALEAHAGFVEARIQNGETPDEVASFYDERFADQPEEPTYLFAQAYLAARRLPAMDDAPAPSVVRVAQEEVAARLARVAQARPREVAVHHLWGVALHHAALRSGRRDLAVAANRQYLLAIDLARERPRARAALLQAVGLLQAALGNHRRALQHFEARAGLPFVRPKGELAFRLARARSAFHGRDPGRALAEAERAAALLDAHPDLRRFRPLVADRLAFHTLQAGDPAGALARYRDLVELLEEAGSPGNRMKARLGVAWAAVAAGEPETAVSAAAEARRILDAEGPPPSEDDDDDDGGGTSRATPPGEDSPAPGEEGSSSTTSETSLLHGYTYAPARYRAVLAGLAARAHRDRGDLDAQRAALEERLRQLEAIRKASQAYEDLSALAGVRYHLGENAYRRGDLDVARSHLEAGLVAHDAYAAESGTPVDAVRLALVRGYAAMVLFGGVPRERLSRDPTVEVEGAYGFITRFPSPNWARDRFVLGLYLTMLRLGSSGPE